MIWRSMAAVRYNLFKTRQEMLGLGLENNIVKRHVTKIMCLE